MKLQNILFTAILFILVVISGLTSTYAKANTGKYLLYSPIAINDTIVTADTTNQNSMANKPLFKDLVNYSAKDSVIFSLDGQMVFLYGEAKVTYLSTELTAAYIELDLENETTLSRGVQDSIGNFKGTPKLKDGTQEFDCKELIYNYKTEKAIVREIVTEENGGFIQGKKTKKLDDKTYCIKDGWYTTCDCHDHPHFYIKMNKAKMIRNEKVFTGFSYLVLEDVPLPLGIPFGFFPITKKGSSGFIIPSYGEEKMRGFNLKDGGYYFAINDYMDFTFTGDIFSNGSWATRVNSNYKKKYKYQGSISLSRSSNKQGEKGLPDYSNSKDFAVKWSHRQDGKANPYSTFSASVDISTSSNDYFNKNQVSDFTNQRKQSSISYSKRWADSPFSMSLAFNHSQNSKDTTISISFPNFNFRMTQIYPFRRKGKVGKLTWYDKIGISYTADLKNSINTQESLLFKSKLTKDWRNGFQHNIPVSASFKLFKDMTFTPSLNYKGVLYANSIRKYWDIENAQVATDTLLGLKYAHNYSASVSIGYSPKIYGMYIFKPNSKISALRHVVSPSISFRYTPKIGVPKDKYWRTFKNTMTDEEIKYQIFQNSLFGVPSGAVESGAISLGLDNNFELKVKTANDSTEVVEEKKIKLLERLKVSTSYDMFRDSLNWSTIKLTGGTKLFNQKLNLNFSGDLDPYALENGKRVNKYAGGIGRLTKTSVTLSANFSSKKGEEAKKDKQEKVWDYHNYIDFDVPWNINFDYSWSYYKTGNNSSQTQILRINGDFKLTPKWKINMSTGYDIKRKEVTSTQFSVYRDLHCWEMSFNAVPFGQHQSFNFEIRIKSSLLKDLKLTKRDSWFDR